MTDEKDRDRAWQHPWLRLARLTRGILRTRWDADTWSAAKTVLQWALAERGRLARAGWFN